MTRKEKLLKKFLAQPESIKYAQLEGILMSLGFEKIEARGSHCKFKHLSLKSDLVIPIHGNDCKAFYKKQACKIIKDNRLY